MRGLVVFILLISTDISVAQLLTKEQAIVFANKLYDVEILSEKGKSLLIEKINKGEFVRYQRPDPSDGSIWEFHELSVSQILYFCSKAFASDYFYRSGRDLQSKIIQDFEDKKGRNITEKDQKKLAKTFLKKMKEFDGYEIEEKIKDEDNFPEEARSFTIYPFLDLGLEARKIINDKRSVAGKTCTKTIKDFYRIGLLDSIVFNESLKMIQQNKLILEALIVNYAAERAAYYEDFEGNKKKEIQFLEGLKDNEIMSQENLNKLIASYKDKELKDKFDFIPYCYNAKVFNLSQYSKDPQEGFGEIFEDIKSIIPDFNYQNFSVKVYDVQNPWDNGLIERKAKIEFQVEGIQYANTFFYDLIRKEPVEDEEPDMLLKVNTEFHKGINKLLADRNSKYRLYFANHREPNQAYSDKEFGLILLTEEQREAWGYSDYFLFEESHDNTFNTHNLQKIIWQYDSIKLFNHLRIEEINEGKMCVVNSEINSYQSILKCFPKTIVYFDWETGNLENPYEALTKEFSQASRGQFNPANIKDNFKDSWKSKTCRYSFEINGKKYEESLEMNTDWLDPKFMGLIKRALKENGLDGDFYYCINDGQASGYIFLNSEQFKYLKQSQPALFSESEE